MVVKVISTVIIFELMDCKNKSVDKARRLFQEMSSKGLSLDVVTYNSLIGGLCIVGRIQVAQELLLKMRTHDLSTKL